MPFRDLDKERWAESILQRYLRSFIPTLQENQGTFQQRDGQTVTAPTIWLHPTQQGSRMPQVSNEELFQRRMRSYRNKGGPA
jgi:hypothetical protein